MIAHRRVDDIHSQRVGIFGSGHPKVFLGQGFGLGVLGAAEHILRIGGCAHVCFGGIGSHRREHHRAMFGLCIHVGGAGHHKVACRHHACPLQGWNLVGIHKTAVEHGYHHAAPALSIAVQLHAAKGFYLLCGNAVGVVGDGVPTVKLGVEGRPQRLSQRVGRLEHLTGFRHHGHGLQLCKGCHTASAHQQGVGPTARAHHLEPSRAHIIYIRCRHGQVGGVDGDVLSTATRQRPRREELFRTVERKARSLFVAQLQAHQIALATRINALVTRRGRYGICMHHPCQQQQYCQ